jgi:phi13 family phage major tail protein
MAKATCKGLTYAKYSSGGSGSAMVYSGGTSKTDYLCNVDMGEERADDKEYADGHLIDHANDMTGATVNLELANMDGDIKADLLGYVAGTSTGELIVTEAEAPYVGVGFIIANRHKGVVTYEGYWYYKVQFSSAGVSSSTKKENVQWEHETINGTAVAVTVETSGAGRFMEQIIGQSTEAAVRTWLNGKAGISG